MKRLQVLGADCAKCKKLADNARTAVEEAGTEATVERVSDMGEILTFDVPTTPALVIDGVVKVAGCVPDVAQIKSWLSQVSAELRPIDPATASSSNPEKCCSGVAAQVEEKTPCCGPVPPTKDWSTEPDVAPWIIGSVDTPTGPIPQVSAELTGSDRLGGWKARWCIRRMRYWVRPRLYAVGNPTSDSPVFVSANYKMSFDHLRSALAGIDSWILVLDTKGINVWCAAGKGTFGTDEVIRRIELTNLVEVVSHKRVIIPQLGAPGVAAHEVRQRSGFRVVYGPVQAKDIPAFLAAGSKATRRMRQVDFPLADRMAVVPVEIIQSSKWALLIAAALFFLSGLWPAGYSWTQTLSAGLVSATLFLLAYAFGSVLTPALLPWLPGRPLAVKGFWTGLGLCAMAGVWQWQTHSTWPVLLETIALSLLILATVSFMAMKFTGSTTYTSLSGVRREMRIAVPFQAAAVLLGVVLWTIGRFI